MTTRSRQHHVLAAAVAAALAAGSALALPGAAAADPTFSAITSWTNPELLPPEFSGGSAQLAKVECTSAIDCVAIGGFDTATGFRSSLLRRTAAGWSDIPDNRFTNLASLSCPSAGHCIAVSWGTAAYAHEEQPDGTFRRITLPTPADAWLPEGVPLLSVSCWSATGCLAVGGYMSRGDQVHPLAYRRTAGGWSLVPAERLAAVAGMQLDTVSCPNSRTCSAIAGWQQVAIQTVDGTAAIAPGGTMPGGGQFMVINDLECPSTGFCVAVGRTGDERGLMIVRVGDAPWKWVGLDAASAQVPGPPGTVVSTLTGVSCPPNSSACTAVGSASGATRVVPFVTRRDPSTGIWSSATRPIGVADAAPVRRVVDTPLDVSCPSAVSCTAVGIHDVYPTTDDWPSRRYGLVVTQTG